MNICELSMKFYMGGKRLLGTNCMIHNKGLSQKCCAIHDLKIISYTENSLLYIFIISDDVLKNCIYFFNY